MLFFLRPPNNPGEAMECINKTRELQPKLAGSPQNLCTGYHVLGRDFFRCPLPRLQDHRTLHALRTTFSFHLSAHSPVYSFAIPSPFAAVFLREGDMSGVLEDEAARLAQVERQTPWWVVMHIRRAWGVVFRRGRQHLKRARLVPNMLADMCRAG